MIRVEGFLSNFFFFFFFFFIFGFFFGFFFFFFFFFHFGFIVRIFFQLLKFSSPIFFKCHRLSPITRRYFDPYVGKLIKDTYWDCLSKKPHSSWFYLKWTALPLKVDCKTSLKFQVLPKFSKMFCSSLACKVLEFFV